MKIAKFLVMLGLCLFLPFPAAAAGPAVAMSPAPLQVPLGQVAPLAVRVADVQGLYGFEMQLKFDPAVIEIEDADPQTLGVQMLPGDLLSVDLLVRNSVDNAAGTAEYVLSQLNPSEAKDGTGTLLTLYVKGLAAGQSSSVEIVGAQFANRDGEAIAVTLTNGQVRVGDAAAPAAASPTPLPTAQQPQIDLTRVIAAQTSAAPAPTATPKATQASASAPPTAAVARAPADTPAPGATPAPANVTTPQGAGSAGGEAPAVEPTVTAAAGPTELAAAPITAQATGGRPAEATSTMAAPKPLATAMIVEQPTAPTHVAAATQAPPRNLLLVAGGGLLLLAAVAAIAVVVVRRGQ